MVFRLNGGTDLDRWWTNLEEYRYIARTDSGFNSTLPNQSDSDMDGLLDGAEFFGYYLEETNFDCHYTPQLAYVCDETLGEQARITYVNLNSIDVGTDPTVLDTDGDGMPDGWEIQHRRWVGTQYNGGNNWSLDPTRAEDAAWDADQDGLPNLVSTSGHWSVKQDLTETSSRSSVNHLIPLPAGQYSTQISSIPMVILSRMGGKQIVNALGPLNDWV